MNVAELERLVAGADDPWQPACMATLNAMSVRLARRVIAAEKLVVALLPVIKDLGQRDMPTPREVDVLYDTLTAYESTK